ncbi:MAG: hypothetical protein Q4P78_00015 [Rothia sp. (in: high G+C Gram-positive bacteria)]|uniref:hypothetical protein n=1 Tax=Rothia sp. (in: high G+C Gram-positive bacteria) TaxID=1885016 RepID=UPI0026DF67E5|nr:hypothetical protein [Rothia sp. (in: high G+C Gram-positive bacteria)]MDO5749577.1 hypothetical protein [Rothia sp. (in: high G+C Gram-positive bacteria)]
MAKSSAPRSSSAQLCITSAIFTVVTLVSSALMFIPLSMSPDAAAGLWALCMIVGTISSLIGLSCALVGLVRFRSYRWQNIVLAAATFLLNPFSVIMFSLVVNPSV